MVNFKGRELHFKQNEGGSATKIEHDWDDILFFTKIKYIYSDMI